MKRTLQLFLIATACFAAISQAAAQAEATPLSLQQALDLAPAYTPDVLTARNGVAAAERSLALLEADPQALPVDLAAAHREVAAAQDAVNLALARARLETGSAYTSFIEAGHAIHQAELQHDLRSISLMGSQARFEAGAATELEVIEAQNALADAEGNLGEARTELEFARDTLQNALGRETAGLVPVTEADLPAVPPAETLLASGATHNARLRTAARSIEAAREQLAAVDNPFSARNQVESARDAVADALTALEDMRAAVDLALRQGLSAVSAAANRYQNAAASQSVATANLEAQQARYEAGSISQVALRESELSYLSAEASVSASLHALLLTLLQLEVTLLQ